MMPGMRRSQCRLARERLGEVAPQFCDRRGGLRGLELGTRGPKRVPPRDRRGRGERRVAAGAAERRRERVVFALPERGLMFEDPGADFNSESFNQPLNKWHVSNVTDMSGMFGGATSFDAHDQKLGKIGGLVIWRFGDKLRWKKSESE